MAARSPRDPASVPAWRRGLTLVRLLLRTRIGGIVVVAIAALAAGVLVARATAPTPEVDARRAIEAHLLPLAIDADSVWSSSSDARPAVSEALVALRRDDDPSLVHEHLATWLEAYDAALVRIAGLDLPPTARPVQRQLISAVTLSRDAVEVLGHAASVDDPVVRRDLTTEVGRLRQRSEQLAQSARASTGDLSGQRVDVAPLAPLTSFLDGRR